jgi:hypothetical protein
VVGAQEDDWLIPGRGEAGIDPADQPLDRNGAGNAMDSVFEVAAGSVPD